MRGAPRGGRIEINVGGPIQFDHFSIGGPLGANPATALRLIARKVMPAFR